MSKAKLNGKEIASNVKLGKCEIIHFTDGTFVIVEMLSDVLKAEEAGFEALEEEDDEEEEAPKKKGGKKVVEEEEDDEEDDDEDEMTIDEMKADLIKGKFSTAKKLKAMDDDDVEDLWNENCAEEEDEEDEDEDEDDEELTMDEIEDMDYDDLEDLIDEKKLDIDIEDYTEKEVKKLRKAVAKALKIK